MISSSLRRVTSLVFNLLKKNPRCPWEIEFCQFHATSLTKQRKEKGSKGFWKRGEDQPKLIKPGNCADLSKPILDPECKNIVITGGAEGFGFAAADYLLCKGARSVIILDSEVEQGQTAAKTLCDYYGKDRVHFVECDVQNICQYEAALKQALCKHKIIHVLFNDLDAERHPIICNVQKKKKNFTTKAIQLGLKTIGKNHGGSGGIIVNCASIFGFLDWPHDPFPVYCKKEPVIELTMDFAEDYTEKDTGVRLVALCPTNKLFTEIGLPDVPDYIPTKQYGDLPPCIPNTKHHIGPALCYVLAWAKSGSTWLVEPAISVHRIPRLIHFPENEGDMVDPTVYDEQPCIVKLEPSCADTSKACQFVPDRNCKTDVSKKK